MKKGFTLIELLVAIAIVAVLMTVGIVSYTPISMKSRNARRVSDLDQVRSALELYRSDNNGNYPAVNVVGNSSFSTSALSGFLTPAYMTKLPSNPKAVSTTMVDYRYITPAGPTTTYYYLCTVMEGASGTFPVGNCPIGSCGAVSDINYCVTTP